ncbi:MAG: hypothetical protein QG608_2140 [Actinomycetota bacterium]|nr:hypothetical protein [Actinomycetota bacterium]
MGKHTQTPPTSRSVQRTVPGQQVTAEPATPVPVVAQKKKNPEPESTHRAETNPYHRPFSDPDSI